VLLLQCTHSGGGGGGGQASKDILGNDVTLSSWLKGHPQPGSRELTQGLKVSGFGRHGQGALDGWAGVPRMCWECKERCKQQPPTHTQS
jgi:hypothetical protein